MKWERFRDGRFGNQFNTGSFFLGVISIIVLYFLVKCV